jgi:hypothetical protein
MKRFGTLQAFYLPLYSREFYKDIADNWKGQCFLFLLLLIAVVCIPLTIETHSLIEKKMMEYVNPIIEQVPDINFSKGRFSTKEQQKYEITDPLNGKVIAIIDTTGETESLEGSDASFLLSDSKIIYRESKSGTRVMDLPKIEGNDKDVFLNKTLLHRVVNAAKKWILIAVYPFGVIFLYVFMILQALIYALIGLILANILKIQLKYGVLVRLSIMALVPGIMFGTFLSIVWMRLYGFEMNSSIRLWNLFIGILIDIGYLYFAIWSQKQNELPEQLT